MSLMTIKFLTALLTVFAQIFFGQWVHASSSDHSEARTSVEHLLAVDRLHYFILSLTDHLEGKVPASTTEALRRISPEDIHAQKFSMESLSDPQKWQDLVYNLLEKKTVSVNHADLEWNYNFFKNKLAGRFSIKNQEASRSSRPLLESRKDTPHLRSIPKISGQKYLLDVERYVAEKTSRAIIWDAILNDRDFEFHIGTLREFKSRIERNNIEIVSEIQPLARNYNKIYLTFNAETGRYSYVINMISGDDRIKHLIAQLRIIRFQNKSYIHPGRDKVRVYGNAHEFHKSQQEQLLDLYQRLPKADKIIIGQKGAIDDAIKSAGLLEVVTQNQVIVKDSLQLEKSKLSNFENLIQKSSSISNFSLEAMQNSPVKIEDAYQKAQDSIDRTYRQFTVETASHEFSDYLLLDSENNVKRWRVISAVWGDEIIPIAETIKKSGHTDIVYIGTAGAIAGKGFKVGDVVMGHSVLTHSGKNLPFSEGSLAPNKDLKAVTVGQVYTPFDETDTWLQRKGAHMDVVEVETGYLRETLGRNVNLETYFLISDIVGSETETLAHAAQSSSKRKKGQIRLLENLFIKNGIKSPVSNFEMLPIDAQVKIALSQLTKLRPSRDIHSLLQVAQVAVREGKTETVHLEQLLKQQPNFERQHMDFSLTTLGSLLVEIQTKLSNNQKVGFISESLSNGTFNPMTQTTLQIYAEGTTASQIKKILGESRLKRFEDALKRSFQIKIVSYNESTKSLGTSFRAFQADDLFKIYEKQTLNRAGFTAEQDASGRFRLKSLPGLATEMRCQAIFL